MVIIDRHISAMPPIEIHIFNIAGDIKIPSLFPEVIITQEIHNSKTSVYRTIYEKKTEKKRGETLSSVR
jgi:hypothetical protein